MINIAGDKVLLMKASDRDVHELYFWKFEEKKQEAKKWNAPYIPEEKVSKEKYLESWREEVFPGVPSSLVIKCNNKVIGYVSCYWVDRNTNWLETGIVIYDSDYWNGGYGTESYQLWISYLFTNTHLHRIGMSSWSGNKRMLAVANKIGMKEEARIREARIVNGEYFDAIKMGMLRSEWRASQR
ncbi:putative acetyltransferase [Bacillus sp. TS-2]|nr:putative acetyltransferase [Bacillus sp. TS-2]